MLMNNTVTMQGTCAQPASVQSSGTAWAVRVRPPRALHETTWTNELHKSLLGLGHPGQVCRGADSLETWGQDHGRELPQAIVEHAYQQACSHWCICAGCWCL